MATDRLLETETSKTTSPETFLSSVTVPLKAWAEIDETMDALRCFYTEEGGIGFQVVTSLTEAILENRIRMSRSSQRVLPRGTVAIKSKVDPISRARETYIHRFLNYIERGEDSAGLGIPTTDLPQSYSRQESARIKPNVEELVRVRAEYNSKYAGLNQQWRDTGNLVVDPFKELIAQGFQVFPAVCNHLRQSDTRESRLFIRLIRDAEMGPVKSILAKVRLSEEKEPSLGNLIAFFAHVATDYYQQGQKDELWAGIELSLADDSNTIEKLMVAGTEDQKLRYLEPLATTAHAKGLPPIIAERFRNWLQQTQVVAWHNFESIVKQDTHANMTRAEGDNTQSLFDSPEKVAREASFGADRPANETDIMTRSQRKNVRQSRPDQSQNNDHRPETEATTPQRLVIFMHKDTTYIAGSEQELADQIRHFFAGTKVKEYTASDIDAYSKIIAKKAGFRVNAPGHREEKMNIDKLEFSGPDGTERTPFFILRRETNSAPRLGVAYPKGFVVLVTAWDRTDNSYRDQKSKFTFGTIELPTLPKPAQEAQ